MNAAVRVIRHNTQVVDDGLQRPTESFDFCFKRAGWSAIGRSADGRKTLLHNELGRTDGAPAVVAVREMGSRGRELRNRRPKRVRPCDHANASRNRPARAVHAVRVMPGARER